MANNVEAGTSTGGTASSLPFSLSLFLSRSITNAILLANYRANSRLVDPKILSRRRSPFRRRRVTPTRGASQLARIIRWSARPAPGIIAAVCSRLGCAIAGGAAAAMVPLAHHHVPALLDGMPAIRSAHFVLASSLVPSHAPAGRDLASCTPFTGLQRSWMCPYMDCEGQLHPWPMLPDP
jgi:hypothetical protein